MLLLVDIGNTRIKWCPSESGADVQALAVSGWAQLPEQWRSLQPQRVLVASVAQDGVFEGLAAACQASLALTPERVTVSDGLDGLKLAYQQPHKLGVDRWLAMLAARALAPGSRFVVISAGTALTADYVDATGQHLGGLIVPGLQMAASSLAGNTGQIGPLDQMAHQRTVPGSWQPGDATLTCVSNGLSALFQGYLAQIIRPPQWQGESFKVFITGGDAALFTQWLPPGIELQPRLVLDGLRHLSRIQ